MCFQLQKPIFVQQTLFLSKFIRVYFYSIRRPNGVRGGGEEGGGGGEEEGGLGVRRRGNMQSGSN